MSNGKMGYVFSYLEKMKEVSQGRACFYRGQSNAEWPLLSGAERRIRSNVGGSASGENIWKGSLRNYHKMLLASVRQGGFDLIDGKKPSDLELLSQLQHFGAATSLLDFSEQAIIALYFACVDSKKKDGKIFIIRNRNIKRLKEHEKIADVLNYDSVLSWQPSLEGIAERRIFSQSSIFLLNISENSEGVNFIKVKKADKPFLLRELNLDFQISTETLFMDAYGFAQNQASTSSLDRGRIWLYKGNQFIDRIENEERKSDNKNLTFYKKAIACYKRSIFFDPDVAVAHYNMALTYEKMGDYEMAFECAQEAVVVDPDDLDSIILMGSIKYDLGEYQNAIDCYTLAITRNAMHYDAHLERGLAWVGLGEFDKAVTDFSRAIQINPNNPAAYGNLGHSLYVLEKYEKATEACYQGIVIDSDELSLYGVRSLALRKLGRIAEAKSDLQTGYEISKRIGDEELAATFSAELKQIKDSEQ